MNWTIEVTKVDNGFYYRDRESDICGVFEESPDDAFGEQEAFASMARQLAESFGIYGSKHDKKRLLIEVVEQQQ